jgi:hypothetical protein
VTFELKPREDINVTSTQNEGPCGINAAADNSFDLGFIMLLMHNVIDD